MKTIIIAIVFIFVSSAFATIINVPADYPTIQQGIDASSDGDTVLVQPGTYYENINFNGHNIVLGSLFLTTGDTSYVEQTVIDGGYPVGRCLTLENYENETTLISGLTIQNGLSERGGGISCINSSPCIANSVIIENWARSSDLGAGGGIYCQGSNATIKDNRFIGNRAHGDYPPGTGGGGAIFALQSNLVIFGNTFSRNTAYGGAIGGSYGGAIAGWGCDAIIESNMFELNTADIYGGAIELRGGQAHISNNAFQGNSSGSGGGLGASNSYVILENNLFSANRAEENYFPDCGKGGYLYADNSEIHIANDIAKGNSAEIIAGAFSCKNSTIDIVNFLGWANSSPAIGGLYNFENCNVRLVNSIFRDDTSSEISIDSLSELQVNYCDIQNTLWPGEGNIDIDPFFRDPENGDFHLMALECGDPYDSPCIDAGHPGILDTILNCNWGLGTERSDMGAYSGGEGAVDIDGPIISIPAKITLSQNYPNPFNASTMIKYELPYQSQVTIEIYDILGRKITTLQNGLQSPGYHQALWQAEDVASGVYFYKLQAGEYSESKKMILVK